MTEPCPMHPDVERPCPKCGIARVRAALKAAPRPPRDVEPKPRHRATKEKP